MVCIKGSYTVHPSESTPRVLWLPEFDQIKGYTHAPLIFIYTLDARHKSNSSPFETLRNSLRNVLVSYYPLTGRLNWIGGGRFELDCNAEGAVIVEAESEGEIKDLGDFRPIPETRKLLPYVDYSKDINELPLLVVQFTRFQCSGITIGVEISHTVVDGTGAFTFINAWASIARGEKLMIEPVHDRTIMYRGNPTGKPRFQHVEHKASPALIGDTDANVNQEEKKETATTMLKLSKTQVDKLKKAANQDMQTTREYTRFEAISGHIWRCLSKARRLQSKQLTSYRISIDCRNRVTPALPRGYYGNTVLATTATAEVGQLLSPGGLAYACGKIRESVDKVNDEFVRSAIDFLASQEDMTALRTGFHTANVSGAHFLGNPNWAMTSWSTLPIYDADFGWGRPIFMGPADIGYDGRAVLIPGSKNNGSFVVPIRVQVVYMDALEKFFYDGLVDQNYKPGVARL